MNSIENPLDDEGNLIIRSFDAERQELIIALRPYKFVTLELIIA